MKNFVVGAGEACPKFLWAGFTRPYFFQKPFDHRAKAFSLAFEWRKPSVCVTCYWL
ncbi:MAG: hypothetical protein N3B10_04875 [Armatimonadetes bacterium]|nr:hypothetical protein [Armatimonadota bacterium]